MNTFFTNREGIRQKIVGLLSIWSLVMVMGSCQEPFEEISGIDVAETITDSSSIFDLIGRITQLDGSGDNIIDNASCLTVVLPVTVIVGDTTFEVSSTDGFEEIERLLDQSPDDTLEVQIVFPITVIDSDYEQETVDNAEELAELRQECVEDGIDDDIECLDIQYPFSLSAYDSETQQATFTTVFDDEDLHAFWDNVNATDLISLVYPITVILFDGTSIEVNNNTELEQIIEAYKDACDEDDDNDFDDDDVDESGLTELLTSRHWTVGRYFGQSDRTSQFETYLFAFEPGGDALASSAGHVTVGGWDVSGDDGQLELEIDFNGAVEVLTLLEMEWRVEEFDSLSVLLTGENSEELLLEVSEDSIEGPTSGFAETITDGSWMLTHLAEDSVDIIGDLGDFEWSFLASGVVLISNGASTFEGNWEASSEGDYIEFDIEFDEDELEIFDQDWVVVSYNESRIDMETPYDPGESQIQLTWEKVE